MTIRPTAPLPRRPGRPKLAEALALVTVHARVRPKVKAWYITEAHRRGMTPSSFMAAALVVYYSMNNNHHSSGGDLAALTAGAPAEEKA
jgi:hypothetical protein